MGLREKLFLYQLEPSIELRNSIVEESLFFVRGKFPRLSADDQQIAALAVIEAVDRFDPSRGTSYFSYIKRAIIFALRTQGHKDFRASRPGPLNDFLDPEPENNLLLDLRSQLTEAEYQVAVCLSGLDGLAIHTHKIVAERFGLSVKDVGRIVASIRLKLSAE